MQRCVLNKVDRESIMGYRERIKNDRGKLKADKQALKGDGEVTWRKMGR